MTGDEMLSKLHPVLFITFFHAPAVTALKTKATLSPIFGCRAAETCPEVVGVRDIIYN